MFAVSTQLQLSMLLVCFVSKPLQVHLNLCVNCRACHATSYHSQTSVPANVEFCRGVQEYRESHSPSSELSLRSRIPLILPCRGGRCGALSSPSGETAQRTSHPEDVPVAVFTLITVAPSPADISSTPSFVPFPPFWLFLKVLQPSFQVSG